MARIGDCLSESTPTRRHPSVFFRWLPRALVLGRWRVSAPRLTGGAWDSFERTGGSSAASREMRLKAPVSRGGWREGLP